ncbi:hypothetical protein [Candidatus Halobonum tyrrellensis]|uniref:Uncharacterized protein n=1 Tax=Candidatus Halobonum tyrrellensis G22 TaxID=1324957 RepID=V4H850_9EURY|nr:hypothetical protein [Candidatus Halobonum tyrrellensis]ESP86850.1 hypothetical protein K933_17242 [Candidatus Halobonum tyrrellensis G22]
MTAADEYVDEIHLEPIENTDRVKATINGVEVAAEQVRVTGPEVVFIADDASVARVETTRPPGTLPNIVCRALVHGETATGTADPEANR